MKFAHGNEFSFQTIEELGAASSTLEVTSSVAASLTAIRKGKGDVAVPLTLVGASTEIMYVTGVSGTTLTLKRGQEGTTAVSWPFGTEAVNKATAASIAYGELSTSKNVAVVISAEGTTMEADVGANLRVSVDATTTVAPYLANDPASGSTRNEFISPMISSSGRYLTTVMDDRDEAIAVVFDRKADTATYLQPTGAWTSDEFQQAISPDETLYAVSNYKDALVELYSLPECTNVARVSFATTGFVSRTNQVWDPQHMAFSEDSSKLIIAGAYQDDTVTASNASAYIPAVVYDVVADSVTIPAFTQLVHDSLFSTVTRGIAHLPAYNTVVIADDSYDSITMLEVYTYDTLEGTWTYVDASDAIYNIADGVARDLVLVSGRYVVATDAETTWEDGAAVPVCTVYDVETGTFSPIKTEVVSTGSNIEGEGNFPLSSGLVLISKSVNGDDKFYLVSPYAGAVVAEGVSTTGRFAYGAYDPLQGEIIVAYSPYSSRDMEYLTLDFAIAAAVEMSTQLDAVDARSQESEIALGNRSWWESVFQFPFLATPSVNSASPSVLPFTSSTLPDGSQSTLYVEDVLAWVASGSAPTVTAGCSYVGRYKMDRVEPVPGSATMYVVGGDVPSPTTLDSSDKGVHLLDISDYSRRDLRRDFSSSPAFAVSASGRYVITAAETSPLVVHVHDLQEYTVKVFSYDDVYVDPNLASAAAGEQYFCVSGSLSTIWMLHIIDFLTGEVIHYSSQQGGVYIRREMEGIDGTTKAAYRWGYTGSVYNDFGIIDLATGTFETGTFPTTTNSVTEGYLAKDPSTGTDFYVAINYTDIVKWDAVGGTVSAPVTVAPSSTSQLELKVSPDGNLLLVADTTNSTFLVLSTVDYSVQHSIPFIATGVSTTGRVSSVAFTLDSANVLVPSIATSRQHEVYNLAAGAYSKPPHWGLHTDATRVSGQFYEVSPGLHSWGTQFNGGALAPSSDATKLVIAAMSDTAAEKGIRIVDLSDNSVVHEEQLDMWCDRSCAWTAADYAVVPNAAESIVTDTDRVYVYDYVGGVAVANTVAFTVPPAAVVYSTTRDALYFVCTDVRSVSGVTTSTETDAFVVVEANAGGPAGWTTVTPPSLSGYCRDVTMNPTDDTIVATVGAAGVAVLQFDAANAPTILKQLSVPDGSRELDVVTYSRDGNYIIAFDSGVETGDNYYAVVVDTGTWAVTEHMITRPADSGSGTNHAIHSACAGADGEVYAAAGPAIYRYAVPSMELVGHYFDGNDSHFGDELPTMNAVTPTAPVIVGSPSSSTDYFYSWAGARKLNVPTKNRVGLELDGAEVAFTLVGHGMARVSNNGQQSDATQLTLTKGNRVIGASVTATAKGMHVRPFDA